MRTANSGGHEQVASRRGPGRKGNGSSETFQDRLVLTGLGVFLAAGVAGAIHLEADQPDSQGAGISAELPYVSQIYLTERVLGVSDGMRANGWSNPDMEQRIDALSAAQPDSIREVLADVYASGYSEGISGKWSEEALDGYMTAAELSRAELGLVHNSDLYAANAAAQLAMTFGPGETAPYVAQAVEGILMTEMSMFDISRDRSKLGIGTHETSPLRAAVSKVGSLDMMPEDLRSTSRAAEIVRTTSAERSALQMEQGEPGKVTDPFVQVLSVDPEDPEPLDP